jgi:16S rRNA (guanine966-N2)-methyltransferase
MPSANRQRAGRAAPRKKEDGVRIVGGRFRGRTLAAPATPATRPTSDRVREAVFNILLHGLADLQIPGARVLDLFAGSGALGLEALSRGANFCLFVDTSPEARAQIRRNVEALGLTGATRIFRRDATDLGPAGTLAGFGLAFLDPPYEGRLGERALLSATTGGWLAPGAVVVLEQQQGTPTVLAPSLTLLARRSWGGTEVLFARHA